jgi:hypothetical protein
MSSNVTVRTVGCALMLCACASAADGAGINMNLVANPAIVQFDTSEAVFAIGDPHGDPRQLAKVLKAANLIKSPPTSWDQVTLWDQVKWAGGRSVLVITGDLIDKGTNSIGVITLVRALQSDAATQGGRVIITMGNHEAEFLANPGGPKTKEFSKELKKAHLDPQKVGSCDGDIGKFLCALPIAARVNDWFFSHAGNTGGRTIDQLNLAIKDGLERVGFATPELKDPNSILEARLNKKGPSKLPWFYKGTSKTNPQTLLTQYAAALMTTEPKVRHLVQGHQYGNVKFLDVTRNDGRFFQRYGLLFLIDTGMSSGITDSNNSGGGALRITGSGSDQKAIVICPNGQETILWSQQKPDHKEQFCSR